MSAGQQRPSGLVWTVLTACFDFIGGSRTHGLPEPVAAYIRGDVAHLPASLGWIPDRMRNLLEMMPDIYAGNADLRKGNTQATSASASAAGTAAVRPVLPLHFEPALPGAALSMAGELRIERVAAGSEAAWFTGTRAQIEAEGLTPTGLRWPQRTERVCWRRGPVQFHMSRCRPAGGPATGWASGDCWRVVACVHNCRALDADVRRLRRELQAAEYRASDAGKRAASQQWTRAIAAASDTAFQGFMRAVLPPGFDRAPARRGRPARTATVKGGAA